MRGELTRQIKVRLDESTINQINDLISQGEFFSMVDFLRYATIQTLKRYEGRSPPPLGLRVPERPRRVPTATAPAVAKSKVPMAGYKK